ncbi:hypothetical protein [Streptomyces sp.]|uniref:hypothetical protein n=1 Tax=Streptomyces sp. TaxID=1931 RepID=UPI002F94F369
MTIEFLVALVAALVGYAVGAFVARAGERRQRRAEVSLRIHQVPPTAAEIARLRALGIGYGGRADSPGRHES